MLIERESGGTVYITVYRKQTHTDNYLDFESLHPVNHMTVVVKTLFSSAKVVCSSDLERNRERKQLNKVLNMNGYLKHFVRSRLCPLSQSVRGEGNEDGEKPVAAAVISYICGVSEAVGQILEPLNIRTAFKPTMTLRKVLVRVKDGVQENKKTAVAYKILCGQCDCVCIGQMSGTLKEHIREHREP